MNWKFLLRKKKALTPREAASKRRLHIFVLCLLCSAMFWLFTKLSQENESAFRQYVIIQEFPEGKTGVNQSESLVQYTLETTGLRLITERYFSPHDTLYLEAEQLPGIQRDDHTTHYVTAEDLKHRLSEKYGDWAHVSQVLPDTIHVEVVPAITKKLPVRLNKVISYEKRFAPYGNQSITPDSVTITGPKTLLDTMDVIRTAFWQEDDIRSSVRKTLDLELPSPLIHAGEKQVRIHIPVEEFTESSISLPITIDCPQTLEDGQLRLFPAYVNVAYLVALRDYRVVNENMFEVSVTCPQAQLTSTDRLHVRLDTYPAFVEVLSIRPSSVDYVILE